MSTVRYFYDFEFIEDGRTIDPISLGIVREDGREYYAVFADVDLRHVKTSEWLISNVLPHLPLNNRGALEQYLGLEDMARGELLGLVDLDLTHPAVKTTPQIAAEVRAFVLDELAEGDTVELWGDYCAYDHVALAQLYGRMIDLPPRFPMFTRDVQDYARHLDVDDEYLPKLGDGTDHHALADAHLTHARWRFLRQVEASLGRPSRAEATPQ